MGFMERETNGSMEKEPPEDRNVKLGTCFFKYLAVLKVANTHVP